MAVRGQVGWAFVFLMCGFSGAAFAADAFSSVAVPQASGFTTTAMSMDDTMNEAKKLVAAMPKAIDVPGPGNASFILQNGSYNNAQVVQSGTRNVGLIAQNGYYNSAVIQQTGAGHQAFIVQHGVGNTAISTQH